MVPSSDGLENEFTMLNHSYDPTSEDTLVASKDQERQPLSSSINRPEARIMSESGSKGNTPLGASAPPLPKVSGFILSKHDCRPLIRYPQGDWVALNDIDEKPNGQTFSVIAIVSEVWGAQPLQKRW